jgi:hypothetical protein
MGIRLTRRGAGLGLLAGGAVALPLSRAWAEDPPTGSHIPQDSPTDVTTGHDPFEHMLAPVSINGQGPFHFLIDTGANVSCVSHELADRLMLAPGAPTQVHTTVGVRTRPSVMIDSLNVGSRTRKDVRAASMPALGPQVDGVLGVDWLVGQRLTLDFKRKSLEISRSHYDESRENHVVVPARKRQGQLTIVDADLSGHRINAMVDSGSQATICNAPLRDLVELIEHHRGQPRTPMPVKLESLVGEPFNGVMFYLPFLKLGGLTLGNVPTVYADAHIFDLWGLKKQPAIVLGMDLLTQFNAVALDYGRSEVRFDLV